MKGTHHPGGKEGGALSGPASGVVGSAMACLCDPSLGGYAPPLLPHSRTRVLVDLNVDLSFSADSYSRRYVLSYRPIPLSTLRESTRSQ
jgi:hypothetical protein